jgi:hypothetical protein
VAAGREVRAHGRDPHLLPCVACPAPCLTASSSHLSHPAVLSAHLMHF